MRIPCSRRQGRRHGPRNDPHFRFRKLSKRFRWDSKVGAKYLRRCMPDPVTGAECAEFREATVIENQNEMSLVWSKSLNRVSPSSWEEENVPFITISRFPVAFEVNRRHPDPSANNVTPFGSGRVPMKFAESSRVQSHRHAGHVLGNRKFMHVGFRSRTTRSNLASLLRSIFHEEFELWKTNNKYFAHLDCTAALV